MRLSRRSLHRSTVRERTNIPLVVLVVMAIFVANACSGGSVGSDATDTLATEFAVADPSAASSILADIEADPSAVQISTRTSFGGDGGFGTFDVVSGADVLGCSAGSFGELSLAYGILRTLTCESGTRTGDFHVFFNEFEGRPGPGDLNATWEARSGTGDFVGLAGGGDWSADFTDDGAAEFFVGIVRWGLYDDEATTNNVLDEAFLVTQSDQVHVPEDQGAFMVAVLGEDDETIHASVGTDPGGIEPTPSDGFRIGSVTKVFTAVATMQLVDDGLVDLDALVTDYVEGISSGVTVRDLLQHTSGIANTHDLPNFVGMLVDDPGHVWAPQEILDLVAELPAAFEPGTDFRYSNSNYLVLGLLIEEVTGRPYHEVIRTRIIEPLELERTYLAGFEVGAEPFGAYTGVTGVIGPVGFDYTSLATAAWAAGAMVSSAEDLHTLFTAMFDGHLVTANSLEQMTDNSVYGLGLELFEWADGLVGHSGQIPGYITFVRHNVASGKTVFSVSTGPNVDQRPALAPLFGTLAQSVEDDD